MLILIFLFNLLRGVDVVNWSIVLILNDSVAIGHSEEGVAVFVIVWLDTVWLMLPQGIILLFCLTARERGNDLIWLDFTILEELIKCGLANGDDLFDDIPEDALRIWSGCQRSRICPSLVVVQFLDKGSEVKLGPFLVNHCAQELVMIIVLFILFEVVVLHSFEQKAQHAMRKFRFFAATRKIWVELMNNMHLKIKELTINGMLRWRVEMSLKAEKFCRSDMPVKQTDGRSLHDILFWLTFHNNLELLTLLFVFCLGMWIKTVVLDLEFNITEVFVNWLLSLEVNWSTFAAKSANII